LRKIIAEQERYISEQKVITERLVQLLSSKEKEIVSLETNNSLLRKQLLNALANLDSVRKEILLQKSK
jgi:uncharacterized Fe-S cluster-containing radical SAM superfamily enzyme